MPGKDAIVLIAWKTRSSDPAIASVRYRVLTPVGLLAARGHQVEVFDESRTALYDMVVFSKAYGPEDQAIARRLRQRGKQAILDLCDNHFYNPFGLPAYQAARRELVTMGRLCTGLVSSTPALARVLKSELGIEAVAVVGDVVEDLELERSSAWPSGTPRLLWFGLHGSPNAPAGMTDVLRISDELERAYASRPFVLVVLSNSREKYDEQIAPLRVPTTYADWTPETFRNEMAVARAVLIPLSDNPFVACKTHNRLTVALRAGVPVIADSIESYREFAPYVWLSDWAGGLEAVLADDVQPVRVRIAQADPYLRAYWSADCIARQWERALGLKSNAPPLAEEEGGLWHAGEGQLIGRVASAAGSSGGELIELMVNGRAVATTRADLPSVRDTDSGQRISAEGGFVFPARTLRQAEPAALRRCSIRFAGSGRPIPGAMVDLQDLT